MLLVIAHGNLPQLFVNKFTWVHLQYKRRYRIPLRTSCGISKGVLTRVGVKTIDYV